MQQLKKGFTFIELSLSILFLSLLSLTVALIISNIISIYNKGLAIKSVNATGSDLIEEFATSINSSPATELAAICATTFNYSSNTSSPYQKCIADQANLFVFNERTAAVQNVDQKTLRTSQLSGAFCTGKYSYIWNTGYVENALYQDASNNQLPAVNVIYLVSDGAGGSIRYETKNLAEYRDFRLLRFDDPSRIACASQLSDFGESADLTKNTYTQVTSGSSYDLTHDATGAAYIISAQPTILLYENENSLALYEFYAARPSQDSTTNRLFYSGSFVLATLRGGVDLLATSDYCQLTGESEDFEYCAINKFNFAAQATGK